MSSMTLAPSALEMFGGVEKFLASRERIVWAVPPGISHRCGCAVGGFRRGHKGLSIPAAVYSSSS